MKKIDLGRISGQKGDKGDKGDGIKLKMGECILVDTKEEAGAELLQHGNEYTINLKIPKPIDGGGDMKLSVYDKEGKCTDIFAYIKENAMTLEGGEFKGSIYLKEGDPTNDREAASKSYVDKKRLESKSDLALLIDAINKSDLGIVRNREGEVLMSLNQVVPVNVDIHTEVEPTNEIALDICEFEIDRKGHRYVQFIAKNLVMEYEIYDQPEQLWGDYIIKKLYIEDESGNKFKVGGIHTLENALTGKLKLKVLMKYARSEEETALQSIVNYTLKIGEINIYLDKKIEIRLPEEG